MQLCTESVLWTVITSGVCTKCYESRYVCEDFIPSNSLVQDYDCTYYMYMITIHCEYTRQKVSYTPWTSIIRIDVYRGNSNVNGILYGIWLWVTHGDLLYKRHKLLTLSTNTFVHQALFLFFVGSVFYFLRGPCWSFF